MQKGKMQKAKGREARGKVENARNKVQKYKGQNAKNNILILPFCILPFVFVFCPLRIIRFRKILFVILLFLRLHHPLENHLLRDGDLDQPKHE